MSNEKQNKVQEGGINITGGTMNVRGDLVGRDKITITGETNMSIFDQRGQHVQYQYNAAGNINFGAVQAATDVTQELEKLKVELQKAKEAGVLSEDTATDTEYQLTKAIQQAKKPEPDKKTILDHLNEAKSLIGDIAAVAGLASAIGQAAQAVQQFIK